ncbi:MAG: hypothetical protein MZV64_34780 [Ignavibacteriales bacterium]|nr:hypothetical protein [Ignavibacteriales bacterium]
MFSLGTFQDSLASFRGRCRHRPRPHRLPSPAPALQRQRQPGASAFYTFEVDGDEHDGQCYFAGGSYARGCPVKVRYLVEPAGSRTASRAALRPRRTTSPSSSSSFRSSAGHFWLQGLGRDRRGEPQPGDWPATVSWRRAG